MKLIIAGTRTLTNPAVVLRAVQHCLRELGWTIEEVVSGGARGADALGEAFAREYKIPLVVFRADWKTHGRRAGPIRNAKMVDYADALLALWDGKSNGTRDVIHQARAAGLSVHVHEYDPAEEVPS